MVEALILFALFMAISAVGAVTARNAILGAVTTALTVAIVFLMVMGLPRPVSKLPDSGVVAAHFRGPFAYVMVDGGRITVTYRVRMSAKEQQQLKQALRMKAQAGGHGKVVRRSKKGDGPRAKAWTYVAQENNGIVKGM